MTNFAFKCIILNFDTPELQKVEHLLNLNDYETDYHTFH